MKEALVSNPTGNNVVVSIRDSPVPTPGESQVVIRVVAAALNPKDWKLLRVMKEPTNQGDDIAGYVHSVGPKVTEFKPGDRVAAFHQMTAPHGGYAEYAVAWAHTTFHIPDETSFEEASTIPLAAMTAALGLYQNLGLPLPWQPARTPTPLIVYGGSSTVGSFAIKLASLSNIHPIIAVAGKGAAQVRNLLDPSKGDTVIDYKAAGNDDAIVRELNNALGGKKARFAFDAISEHNSYVNIGRVLDPAAGRITVVLPGRKYNMPIDIKPVITTVGSVHTNRNQRNEPGGKVGKLGDQEFGAVFFRFFGRGLAGGWFTGHPYRIVERGLEGIASALNDLREGKVSGFKYVVRIADTPGLGAKL
ncbi:hypothetical protein VTO42DRAFT_4165 [Malbranchea cinnamomea]